MHEVVIEGALAHHRAVSWRVDRLINVFDRVVFRLGHPQGVGGKRQIVVPRKHADAPIFLVEQVVVARRPQIAVEVYRERLHHEVAQRLLDHNGRRQIGLGHAVAGNRLRQHAQRFDQAPLIRRVNRHKRLAEDVVVERGVIARVAQRHVGVLLVEIPIIGLVQSTEV